MYSQQEGPPMDPSAYRAANEEVRHEMVADPRVIKIMHHDPYTPSELFAHHPPVTEPPPSSTYRPPTSKSSKRLRKQKKKRFGRLIVPTCDLTVGFILAAFIPAVIALVLESIAFNQDEAWASMIDDGDPFPTLSAGNSLRYFDNKKFVMDTSLSRLAEIRELIKRDTTMEAIAIGFVVVGMVIVLLTLLMYMEGEAYKRTVVFAHFPAGLLALAAAVLIFVSDDQIDGNHSKAAGQLELFFQDVMDHKHVDAFMQLHLEAVEEIGVQTLNLIAIQKTCALGNSPDGRMSGSSNTHYMYLLLDKEHIQKITLEDLRDLNFCSLEMYKHSAGVMLLLYFILCYIIPAIYYCQTLYSEVEPDKEDYDLGTDTEPQEEGSSTWIKPLSPPPPAYGYGSGGGRDGDTNLVNVPAVEETFDDRPKLGVEDLLEDDILQLSLLHKQAMRQAHDTDINDLDAESNQSIMFISRPTSPGRGDSSNRSNPSDLKRIGELENKVRRLSEKIEQAELPRSRPTSAKKKNR